MGKLIYSMITSLDGYVTDAEGNFDWSVPGETLHQFVNDLMQSVGTYLYGRRMYETMVAWETLHTLPDQPPFMLEFANTWQATDKIVYSTSLGEVASKRTRIERTFDPDAVRTLKEDSELDITIDGPTLAAHAIRAGLVDQYELFIVPAIVGGGKRFFPDDVRVDLELLDERRFGSGVVYLSYGVANRTVAVP
ncbi:dihydrofolate reductase family protein [Cryobacterium sp. BB736]|uniref:dihydrofolate reductase family protein n=1 Tax=Cryobacterium sp. BB736 TaxID=2746963 RepID=UPI0018751EC6|nr:dihydrofolate reductase family protein [Cryobacterium sp. BB736]